MTEFFHRDQVESSQQPIAVSKSLLDGFDRAWKGIVLLLLGLLLLAVPLATWVVVIRLPTLPLSSPAAPATTVAASATTDTRGVVKVDANTVFDLTAQNTLFGGDVRVKRAAGEMLIDVDPNPPLSTEPMKPRLRIALSYFTAKRLLSALSTTFQRHEAVFGVVEVSAVKRPNSSETPTPFLSVIYANYCRVTATPEELLLDFGLNRNPFAEGSITVKMDQLVVMSPVGGKKLLVEMEKELRAQEAEFGVLELDVRKRAKNLPKP